MEQKRDVDKATASDSNTETLKLPELDQTEEVEAEVVQETITDGSMERNAFVRYLERKFR